jgi:thiamine biosynthesis protein ThiI
MAVLVRYAEIGIKGKNRDKFEHALVAGIEHCLRRHNVKFSRVRRMYGRIFIETDDLCLCLKHVFGIASFSPAISVGRTMEDAFTASNPLVAKLSEKDSFRVSCQRLDKNFPMKSNEVCSKLGEMLRTATKAKVKMENATVDVAFEIIADTIYLLLGRTEGPGGMPIGSEGKVIALIEDESSVLAALMIMKRGCEIIPAMLKEIDLSLLEKFACGQEIKPWRISSINELDKITANHNALAVVINDTFEKIRNTSLKSLVLRPLSGLSQEEIKNERNAMQA